MLDENLIDELFEKSECGFKKKFKINFEDWKKKPLGEMALDSNFSPVSNCNASVSSLNFPEININVQATNSFPLLTPEKNQIADGFVNESGEITLLSMFFQIFINKLDF